MNRLSELSVHALVAAGVDLGVRHRCAHGCEHCQGIERASKTTLYTDEENPPWGGSRPGAGRRPSTVQGYLKCVPFNVARTLERRFLAELEAVLEAIHIREQTGVELEPGLSGSDTKTEADENKTAQSDAA